MERIVLFVKKEKEKRVRATVPAGRDSGFVKNQTPPGSFRLTPGTRRPQGRAKTKCSFVKKYLATRLNRRIVESVSDLVRDFATGRTYHPDAGEDRIENLP
jgi:hypothetical protein